MSRVVKSLFLSTIFTNISKKDMLDIYMLDIYINKMRETFIYREQKTSLKSLVDDYETD